MAYDMMNEPGNNGGLILPAHYADIQEPVDGPGVVGAIRDALTGFTAKTILGTYAALQTLAAFTQPAYAADIDAAARKPQDYSEAQMNAAEANFLKEMDITYDDKPKPAKKTTGRADPVRPVTSGNNDDNPIITVSGMGEYRDEAAQGIVQGRLYGTSDSGNTVGFGIVEAGYHSELDATAGAGLALGHYFEGNDLALRLNLMYKQAIDSGEFTQEDFTVIKGEVEAWLGNYFEGRVRYSQAEGVIVDTDNLETLTGANVLEAEVLGRVWKDILEENDGLKLFLNGRWMDSEGVSDHNHFSDDDSIEGTSYGFGGEYQNAGRGIAVRAGVDFNDYKWAGRPDNDDKGAMAFVRVIANWWPGEGKLSQVPVVDSARPHLYDDIHTPIVVFTGDYELPPAPVIPSYTPPEDNTADPAEGDGGTVGTTDPDADPAEGDGGTVGTKALGTPPADKPKPASGTGGTIGAALKPSTTSTASYAATTSLDAPRRATGAGGSIGPN